MEEWRLIVDPPARGHENMAVDEALLISSERGEGPPTIRFYEWSVPTISIGYRQKYDNFQDAVTPVVRRISGGRAVLHNAELTYSIVCDNQNPLFAGGIYGTYALISRAIKSALQDLAYNATLAPRERSLTDGPKRESCFSSSSGYEILISGKKVAGSAQRRYKRSFLQHGSILCDIDSKMVRAVFGERALDSMAWLNLFKEVGSGDLRDACIKRVEKTLGVRLRRGGLTDGEESLRDRLVYDKYSRDTWNIKGNRDEPGYSR